MKQVFFSPGPGNQSGGGAKAPSHKQEETKTGAAPEKPAEETGKEIEGKGKTPLKPTLTKPTAKHGKNEDVLVLRPGQVYVVPVDAQGNEIEGAGFITNQAAVNRHYSNPKQFVTKKKAS